jgi:hypothetical protein
MDGIMSEAPESDPAVRALHAANELLAEQPSAGVRARVLAAAAMRGAGARPADVGGGRRARRWLFPPWLAGAAVTGMVSLLCVGVVWRMVQEDGANVAVPGAVPTAPGAAAPDRAARLGDSSALPAERPTLPRDKAQSAAPAPAARAPAAIPADRPPPGEAPPAAEADAAPAASATTAPGARVGTMSATEDAAGVAAGPGDRAPEVAPAPAAARTAPAAAKSMLRVSPAVVPAPPAETAATPPAPAYRADAPAWLARIRELRTARRDSEAGEELRLFRLAHPDQVIPADLLAPF